MFQLKHDGDIIKELRLRRWARKNYVEFELRSDAWHPVVLDEMDRRDEELEELAPAQSAGANYVPLVPSPMRRWHRAHEVPEPNFNLMRYEVPAESFTFGQEDVLFS